MNRKQSREEKILIPWPDLENWCFKQLTKREGPLPVSMQARSFTRR
jgi:hypothetical protein